MKKTVARKKTPPTWDTLIPKLRRVGKQISPRVVKEAVAWARKNNLDYRA